MIIYGAEEKQQIRCYQIIRSDQITEARGFYISPIPSSESQAMPTSEIGPRALASSQNAMEAFDHDHRLAKSLSSSVFTPTLTLHK
jgi:hypothetical protein